MAQIANITVKKADGTTDVTYQAVSGSSTDGSPAMWVEPTSATTRGFRRSFSFKARLNGTKQARRVELRVMHPVVRVVGGLETLVGSIPVDLTLPVPEWATDAEVSEAVEQSFNLFSDVTVRAQVKTGMAFT